MSVLRHFSIEIQVMVVNCWNNADWQLTFWVWVVHLSEMWKTQAQNVSYQFILFRQFTTLTFNRHLPLGPLLHRHLPHRPLLHRNLPFRPLLHRHLPLRPLVYRHLPLRPLLHRHLPLRPLLHRHLPLRPLLHGHLPLRQTHLENILVFILFITDTDEPIQNISLSNNQIWENATVGTEVGILNAYDPDIHRSQRMTFSIVDPNDGHFRLQGESGDVLTLDRPVNFEVDPVLYVNIRVNDTGGSYLTWLFQINVKGKIWKVFVSTAHAKYRTTLCACETMLSA